jgi:methyl-accepting chemotaxis protein
MSLKNLSVSNKVIAAFALTIFATIALGVFSITRLSQLNANTAELRGDWMPSIRLLAEFRYSVTRFRSFEGAALLAGTDAQHEENRKMLDTLATQASAALTKYEPLVTAGKERELTDAIKDAWTAYFPMLEQEMEINRTKGATAAAEFYQKEMRAAFGKLNDAINADIKFNNDGGVEAGDRSAETYATARLFIIGALGLSVLLGFGAGFFLIRGVSAPLVKMTGAMAELAAGRLDAHVPHADQKDEIGKLAEAMTTFKNQLAAAERSKAEQTEVIVSSIGAGLDHLAKGDLTHRVTAELTGPFAKLKEDFNAALSRLQETLKNVLNSTSQISTGAGEISQAADDLSRRTEQQAASLEQTAAALEEITSTVKKTSANTREASTSAATAKTAAEEGGRVVETAIRAMDSISQSSKQITEIIGVIDEIAFQTNLLALNAGVEAARAGEAGRGFAVVASEVRALAQRSSDAAKEIKTLIKASGEHVGAGVKYVGESGDALKRIVEQVVQINDLVREMAQAAEQQSTGIEEVNSAVGQMDQVTQQNAAMVEQSTAASRNLATETQTLSRLVGFFSVGGESKPAAAPAPVAARPRPAVVTAKARPQPARAAARSGGAASNLAVAEDWTEF